MAVIVLTGGNSGIGLAAATTLARAGHTVAITSRDPVKGGRARRHIEDRSGGEVVLLPLDLSSFRSIRACAAEVLERWDRLDALVCNAGAILSSRRVTQDGFEMTFGANHLGHFLLTSLLEPRLRSTADQHGGARVVVASSVAHKFASGGLVWADLEYERRVYNGTAAYNASKLANVLFTLELARRLQGTGVVANCFHPGAVRSGFGAGSDTRGIEKLTLTVGRPFMIGQGTGSKPIVELAVGERWATETGRYVVRGYVPKVRVHAPSRFAADPANGRRLWEISEELVASVPS